MLFTLIEIMLRVLLVRTTPGCAGPQACIYSGTPVYINNLTKKIYYNGDHRVMYRNIETLRCVPVTNTVLCVNYTAIKKKKVLQNHEPI